MADKLPGNAEFKRHERGPTVLGTCLGLRIANPLLRGIADLVQKVAIVSKELIAQPSNEAYDFHCNSPENKIGRLIIG